MILSLSHALSAFFLHTHTITAVPLAPSISSVTPAKTTLSLTWTASHTPSRPISGFTGTIEVEGQIIIQFNLTNVANRKYTPNAKDFLFQEDKTHMITICAYNKNGQNCSQPYRLSSVTPQSIITPQPIRTPPGHRLGPGLIAGIVVAVVVILCCCLLLLLLLLCCCWWREERGRSYLPGNTIS